MPNGRSSAISRAENMPAEPAEAALVVALVEARALPEHFARSESNDSSTATSIATTSDGDHRRHDDARALRVRSAGQDHQRQHEG